MSLLGTGTDVDTGVLVVNKTRGTAVDVASLTCWADDDAGILADKAVDQPVFETPPFAPDDAINRKLLAWSGDITRLAVDAIVCPSNEALTDRQGVAGKIFHAAGVELEVAVASLDGCRTGDAEIVKGFELPASNVILTVGPRFNIKYQTAAENALHNCYRNSMQRLLENKQSSIAFPVLHSQQRGFPPTHGAHIALRTLRRFLERYGDQVDALVLVLPQGTQDKMRDVYCSILPLYFPRNDTEADLARFNLPKDIGNENGETVLEERNIRISALGGMDDASAASSSSPSGSSSSSAGTTSFFEGDSIVGSVSASHFSSMSEDYDVKKMNKLANKPRKEREYEEAQLAISKYQRMARQNNMRPYADLKFMYTSGHDPHGRTILVVVGAHFPANEVDLELAMAYIVSVLEPVARDDYVVVYCHSGTESENLPTYQWLYSCYTLFSSIPHYSNNLRRLYVLHTSFWVKAFFWFVSPTADFYSRIEYLDSVSQLYNHVEFEEVSLPDLVFSVDVDLNGPLDQRQVTKGNISYDDL